MTTSSSSSTEFSETDLLDVKELLKTMMALKQGDFSVRLPIEWTGMAGKIADTFNTVVETNENMASELERLRQAVAKEGKINQRARMGEFAGSWFQMMECVNSLIDELVRPTSEMSRVIGAVAKGDLSQEAALEIKGRALEGEFLQTGRTINTMVDRLRSFTSEVTRVAREVGTEGKLGGQAIVPGVAGTWKDLADNVNLMASNLTSQVRNFADITTAVANGDFSKKITADVRGEFLQLKEKVNTMVDQLSLFTTEVTRVAREVGTEGKLGSQAIAPGAAGTWKDLTDNVNFMASNLTSQVRNIADITTAVANGDFSKKITADVRGEFLQLKEKVNIMVDQLSLFTTEVTRVAREVGTEGKLGSQAIAPGAAGTWKALTDNVNFMASNLTSQVRDIADITTAVANGDFSKKITADVRGEFLQLKEKVNTMVDQLSLFTTEVTRVAREVGVEGKLSGQAIAPGAAGTWKELTDNVNFMSSNLTSQVRNIADVTTAVANGDFSKKITADVRGEFLQLKDKVNIMVDQLALFTSEVTRVAREVGTEGKLGSQAIAPGAAGTWKDLTDNVNFMSSNLTSQVRNIADITTAVANGDFSKKITADVRGEFLQLKEKVNIMVDQLGLFTTEVTRVAREVGTEGKLGSLAIAPGAAGTWKELTDNVNFMSLNLTSQVRNIADITTAVANGDLSTKITADVRGEFLQLKEKVNTMVDQLRFFTSEVTRVAREVGVEGKLGGQAIAPGAAGTWKELTDNVNQLAANLTTQVRSISEVVSSVASGDLTRSIRMDASGEVETLKDTINQMIANLRGTTLKNSEQVWLKTNLARFALMLQGQRDLPTVAKAILSELNLVVAAQHSTFYIAESKKTGAIRLKLLSSFAYRPRPDLPQEFGLGEGLVGQCAQEKTRIFLNNVPGNYIRISSGLGEAVPLNIVVLPILFEGVIKGVLELASFEVFTTVHLSFLEQLMGSIGIVINTLEANLRTETLLKNLQSQQEELQKSNQELGEKADQLALSSKYKSEFLSNMSHELRTPLNSMLILSQQLAEDSKSLTPKQVEYAQTIHASGGDLLLLINDILDLAKVESGAMSVNLDTVTFVEMRNRLDRLFRHVAEGKGLNFNVEFDPSLGSDIYTDSKRLEQILRNLLSNAFKFTEKGQVKLRVAPAMGGWSADHPILSKTPEVIAFYVSDTGIGITTDKQKIIFEAFQQGESGTSRKYGGTGLGLSISREFAKLLGGQLTIASSQLGHGSTFVIYMPKNYVKVNPDKTVLLFDNKPIPSLALARRRDLAPRGEAAPAPRMEVPDDRKNIQFGDKIFLIVEDDPSFARILLDMARDKGFKGLVAMSCESALRLADEFPPSAVTLDIQLPDTDGWKILTHFKNDLATRHIPVEIISADEEEILRGFKQGALGFLSKPVSKEGLQKVFEDIQKSMESPAQQVLLVCAKPDQRKKLKAMLETDKVKVSAVSTGKEALSLLKKGDLNCVVLELPGVEGFKVLEDIHASSKYAHLPTVVYLHGNLTPKEDKELKQTAKIRVIKEAASPERVMDNVSFFLHQVVAQLPEVHRHKIEQMHQSNNVLIGRKVLVVDDDIRNIFAMTSLLEHQKMKVLSAESGREAVELLEKNREVDIVLMDIMMPEMDGYDTMRAIRQKEIFNSIPIIALTAKAMKGDREKCIESGASDYITKPVDTEQLLALMRTWLNR
jgi:HAMP domain-containing protein/signal transduction histidine kinase/CheY-like chemotaxis protein